MNLSEYIKQLLADVVSFYYKAHSAHWNVMGVSFQQYHELFGEIYEDTFGSVDTIAEFMRKLGTQVPSNLQDITKLTKIPVETVNPDPTSLATCLLNDNKIVLDCLNTAFEYATKANEQGIANFIAERIDMHQKWQWQLSASLGKEVNGKSTPALPEKKLTSKPIVAGALPGIIIGINKK